MPIETTLEFDENAMKDVVQETIVNFGNEVFALSQQNLSKNGTIDRGTLLKSGKIIIRVLEVEIAYDAPHAMAIENGRAPGTMPPVSAIRGWVQRKLPAKDADALAWAIATKIKERGSEAQPYMMPAINTVKRKFLR